MTNRDWTQSEGGTANNSALFIELQERLAQILVSSATNLITGQTQSVARLILAQLAHVYHFGPQIDEREDVCAFIRASVEEREQFLSRAIAQRRLTRKRGEGQTQDRILDVLRIVLTHIEHGDHVGASRPSADHIIPKF